MLIKGNLSPQTLKTCSWIKAWFEFLFELIWLGFEEGGYNEFGVRAGSATKAAAKNADDGEFGGVALW